MKAAKDSATSPVKSTRQEVVDPSVSDLGSKSETASGRVPVAYALVPAKNKPGLYYSVELKDVRFKKVKILEPGGSPERKNGGSARLETALIERSFMDRDGGWETEFMRRGRR
jgi:hypothetical protein